MKTVQCPLCLANIHSETFRSGESFACPNCEQQITISPYENNPVASASEDIAERMNWAKSIWKDGRLVLTREKLSILGESMADTIEMPRWAGETLDQLIERRKSLVSFQKICTESGFKPDLAATGVLLLDIYINLRQEQESQGG